MPFWWSRQFLFKFPDKVFQYAKRNSCQYITFKNALRSVGQVTFNRPLTSQKINVSNTKAKKTSEDMPVKVLNVAEKNDAAKSISDLLARGRFSRKEGFSVYNKIYQFPYQVRGQACDMLMTSVSGHLLNYDFGDQYRKWKKD